MKLHFAYDEKGRVAFYSETPNKADMFEVCELEVTDEQMSMIKENYILWIRDNELIFEKPERMIREEIEKETADAKQELRAKLETGKATLKDISQLLLKIL